jgi:hypothetical protein
MGARRDPTALSFVARLTVLFRARYPDVGFSIYSLNSHAIIERLENLELDAGLTYVENESLKRLQYVSLYAEQYALLVSPKSPLAKLESISWREGATAVMPPRPICRTAASRPALGRRALPPTLSDSMRCYSRTRSGGAEHHSGAFRGDVRRAVGAEGDCVGGAGGIASNRAGDGTPRAAFAVLEAPKTGGAAKRRHRRRLAGLKAAY